MGASRMRRRALQAGIPLAIFSAGVGALLLRRRWAFPVRFHERETSVMPEPPVAPPHEPDVQEPEEGSGPHNHRRYRVRIAGADCTAEELLERITRDVDHFVPGEFTHFEKTTGAPERMAVGDEYLVHLRGPWQGPVRVIDLQPDSFTFATLRGHVEAGTIRFAVEPEPDRGTLVFSIESWSRHRDRVIELTYEELKLGRQIQQTIWLHFCEQVVAASGGERVGDMDVFTERTPEERLEPQ